MRHHEHLPPFDHEPNWEDREKFGPFGYQLPFIADVYASGYELDRVARAHGDNRNNNPYSATPDGLWDESVHGFSLSQVNTVARYFFNSTRDGRRVFAAEFLAAKQKYILNRIEDPRTPLVEADATVGAFDPDFEMQSWLMALETDNPVAVLESYWDFLGIVADDDDARIRVPIGLQVADFDSLLSAVYTRMTTAAQSQTQ